MVIGENGTGKTHVLKAAYSAIAVSAARSKDGTTDLPSKAQLQLALGDKLQGVFCPDGLSRLVRRKQGLSKCRLSYKFNVPNLNLEFGFSNRAKTEVEIESMPSERVEKLPVFLPTRELLTIYPGFVSLYETTRLSFEETWRDTCILLGAPLARGPRESRIKKLLVPLEEAMGGKVELDPSGRFYLYLSSSGAMEMHLVAEGLRKLATIARLIATGSLQISILRASRLSPGRFFRSHVTVFKFLLPRIACFFCVNFTYCNSASLKSSIRVISASISAPKVL